MSQIPDHSPQVQRPGWQIKTAELQWLCYSTPSSFPTGQLQWGYWFVFVCVLVCVWVCYRVATAPTGTKVRGWKMGEVTRRELFSFFLQEAKDCSLFSSLIKPLRTKSWQPEAARKNSEARIRRHVQTRVMMYSAKIVDPIFWGFFLLLSGCGNAWDNDENSPAICKRVLLLMLPKLRAYTASL